MSTDGVIIVGFTGTREGMTADQMEGVAALLDQYRTAGAKIAHHGVCTGSDDDFDWLAKLAGYQTIGHPGVNAHGQCPTRGRRKPDVMLAEEPFLVRDRKIVDVITVLIATPKSRFEETRSGTWATVRYARQVRREIAIVYPETV